MLGQIDTPDYRYYRIAWTDGEGNERTGFVPVAYVTAFDGSPVPAEQANFGGTGADTDSVWRLAFLLLRLRVRLRPGRFSHHQAQGKISDNNRPKKNPSRPRALLAAGIFHSSIPCPFLFLFFPTIFLILFPN